MHLNTLLAAQTLYHGLSHGLLNSRSLPAVDLGYVVHQASAFSDPGFYNFSNIRYARPPILDLRFRPPQPPQVDRSVIQDGSRGLACLQAIPGWAASPSTAAFKSLNQGEDCLFLDVFVPKVVFNEISRAPGVPVVVWIHGGGNVYGSKDYQTDPYGLMLRAQEHYSNGIIFVAMNYRLGAFGWLAGPTFQTNGTANAGLHDQRMAFEWIRKYIRLFGGDKDRVTALGYSAGAGSIAHHLTAYGGRLTTPFQQAISQSPVWIPLPSSNLQEVRFQEYLAAANVSSLAQLRSLPSNALMVANTALVSRSTHRQFTFGPAVDGDYVTQDPKQLLSHGQFDHSVRLLASHASNEGKDFGPPNVTSDADYNHFIRDFYPSADDKALEHIRTNLYPPVSNTSIYRNNSGRAALTISDSILDCNVATLSSAYGDRGYEYLFAIPPGVHTQDLPYTFYHQGSNASAVVANSTVARAIQEYLISFAYGERPTTSLENAPDFNLYGASAAILSLDNNGIAQTKDPAANQRCDWWKLVLLS
ncbi:carboxylesterase family protein [Periconia macrospinosa]|uniref:Carboxylesterase family protein n=1 Tax=Periconia macrospinosa TaxID=97972 RepID=A0A2V1DT08_9PLEO|nr:carboxylesterase family protein [Periconia macrospinosa]